MRANPPTFTFSSGGPYRDRALFSLSASASLYLIGTTATVPYQATGRPKSLDHKFITEDVPTGLIPMNALEVAAWVRTPEIDALIEIVRDMTGKDFASEERTLGRLGLGGMEAAQIRHVVETGFS